MDSQTIAIRDLDHFNQVRKMIEEERRRRVLGNPDRFVALPVFDQSQPPDSDKVILVWQIGLPDSTWVDSTGVPDRRLLTVATPHGYRHGQELIVRTQMAAEAMCRAFNAQLGGHTSLATMIRVSTETTTDG